MQTKIRLAQREDLEGLALLFDGYRRFYGQQSDIRGAETFLRERLTGGDSVLLVAEGFDAALVGFTQLYPSFSSAGMYRSFILNDLFVLPEARRAGVARALMQAAEQHARSVHAARLTLATGVDNLSAQRLYESLGYRREDSFFHYQLQVHG